MYRAYLLPSAGKDLDSFDRTVFTRIRDKIASLAREPRPYGCVKLTAEEGYRIRAGDYRILYRIDDRRRIVYIYRVKHRKNAYG